MWQAGVAVGAGGDQRSSPARRAPAGRLNAGRPAPNRIDQCAIGLTATPAALAPLPGLTLPSIAPDCISNFEVLEVLALDAQKVPSPTRSRPPQWLFSPGQK